MTHFDSFLLHDLTAPLADQHRGCVLAIGNFDGVHRGHQVVLNTAKNMAVAQNFPCFALSFEPHPRTFFKPQSPVFRLTSEQQKARVMAAFGVDGLLNLPFTKDLAATSADDFVDESLVDLTGSSHIVTGYDFHFGKNRQGSPEFLIKAGENRGFGVTIVSAHSDDNAEPISSSRIRRHLGSGEIDEASALLGYRWCVSGKVIKGAQLGRTLGYPTANLSLPESCHLAHGIYAVRLRRADGRLHNGVASYGRRPTFDNGEALLETFVFDFEDDLYDEIVEVSLFAWLRGEEKFDSADALVEQMKRDEAAARAGLATCAPISKLDQVLAFDGLTT